MAEITEARQLCDDLAAHCKAVDRCLIGIEHEVFLFTRADHRPLRYAGRDGIRAVLEAFQRFGWRPSREGERLVGLTRGAAAITLEPAGQLELSGAPWADLHGVQAEMLGFRRELAEIAEAMGLGVMALGFAPEWTRREMDWVPKSRYRIMRAYMPRVGVHGKDMMTRSCAFQLNVDFCSEEDMRAKFRVAMALQPLVMVALANSPFADGRDSSLTSYRHYVWLHTDSARCGILPLALSPTLSFAEFVDRALAVPMYSVARHGEHLDLAGRRFPDMMRGALVELPGERPTLQDWKAHLNTLMHDVRLKDHLELRGNDSLSLEYSLALAAFWTGILYDRQALAGALALVADCDVARLNQLRHELPRYGLAESERIPVAGIYAADSFPQALERALALAEAGLQRRHRLDAQGQDERRYLRPLQAVVALGRSPAEHWRSRYHGRWRGDLGPLYERASL
ncbi:glutamate--cysteine ligase [Halomonas stenophila]|uniref:Glutamate--cysteine ligase n=1 Tax=Halomonas stenophila TaxID=795312 RepID=A0A7W5HK80_9GAMM|nr:glutamate-cysteine ligase family protein [Halomonas stenophila]MBB3230187.1 glutamate--cysteine ligase [Halomonas stenophila]